MLNFFNKPNKIHFVGIGGSGMSGIAEVLLNLGNRITGSDLKKSEITLRLENLGAKIYYGRHSQKNVDDDVDVVVYSSAIKSNNPELVVARKKKIPVIPRIEMLAEIARLKYTISVCGTHGKTTTTSMMGLMLDKCGYDPTIVVGGKFMNIGTGAKIGKGEFIVVESDESDGSFLKLSPYIVICTNIDNDHLDYYGNMNYLKNAFIEHFNSVPFYGFNVLYGDDKNIRSLLPSIHRKFYTYGLNPKNNFFAKEIEFYNDYTEFNVYYQDKFITKIKLKIPGLHNVLNSLSVISCGIISGLEIKKIASSLEEFEGVGRRLEYKGCIKINNKIIDVYDDYGHHPTEIYNTLSALRTKVNKDIVVIFQPHRYTRTKLLYKQFYKGFSKKDKIFLLPIYPANEKPIKGVSAKLIYDDMRNRNYNITWYSEKKLINSLTGNEVILTLGAGSVYKIGEEIIQKYGVKSS